MADSALGYLRWGVAQHPTVTGRPFRIHRNSGLPARHDSAMNSAGGSRVDSSPGHLQSSQAHSASTASVGSGIAAPGSWTSVGVGGGAVRKLNLSTIETVEAIGSSRLFQRLRFHQWLRPLAPSRDALYPVSRVLAVQARMEQGELPPLLPSEVKELAQRKAERLPAA